MYKDLEAKLHDVFWNAEAPDVELGLIREFLEGRGGKSLEIGCGSGRILLPLREAGFEVDGNDVSRDMLDLLEAAEGGDVPELFHGVTLDQDVSGYQQLLPQLFCYLHL